MTTPSSSDAAGRPWTTYWLESRLPLTSLVFIAPLLILYETGVLVLGPRGARNGADAWMRQWLDMLGFGQYFLLPLLTVGVLLGWHHLSRRPWRISRGVLGGMCGECLLLAFCLRLLPYMMSAVRNSFASVPLSISDIILDRAATMTSYLGAGIYEELLFRLILLSAGIGMLRWLRASPRASTIGAVVATSLLFAAAHYVGAQGEPLAVFSFIFRLLAGMFFCVLFLYRGFGIAAGAHAGYDVLVGIASV